MSASPSPPPRRRYSRPPGAALPSRKAAEKDSLVAEEVGDADYVRKTPASRRNAAKRKHAATPKLKDIITDNDASAAKDTCDINDASEAVVTKSRAAGENNTIRPKHEDTDSGMDVPAAEEELSTSEGISDTEDASSEPEAVESKAGNKTRAVNDALRATPRESGSAALRKRKGAGKATKPVSISKRGKTAGKEHADTGTAIPIGGFLLGVASDIVSFSKGLLQTVFRSYPVWKWSIVIYASWIILTYAVSYAYHRGREAVVETICPIPLVGPWVPLCQTLPPPAVRTPPADFDMLSQVTSPQEQLARAMDTVGKDFSLSTDILDHYFAIQDLKIRVGGSKLAERERLASDLDSLAKSTKTMARKLSSFSVKVFSAVDYMKSFDDHMLQVVERLSQEAAHKRQGENGLVSLATAALHPFAAFFAFDQTGDQVKELFLDATGYMRQRVTLLIKEIKLLSSNLDDIEHLLFNIATTASHEISKLPKDGALQALWALLAQPGDHKYLKVPHAAVLRDVMRLYKEASATVKNVTGALNQAWAELEQYNLEYASPSLMLQNQTLELIAKKIQSSRKRLEASGNKFEGYRKRVDRRPEEPALIE